MSALTIIRIVSGIAANDDSYLPPASALRAAA